LGVGSKNWEGLPKKRVIHAAEKEEIKEGKRSKEKRVGVGWLGDTRDIKDQANWQKKLASRLRGGTC